MTTSRIDPSLLAAGRQSLSSPLNPSARDELPAKREAARNSVFRATARAKHELKPILGTPVCQTSCDLQEGGSEPEG